MTFSIGDVLEQLHDEFPDITVSKIRFLESQGLIAPMRTSSGFRMFSEVDITKLKWILSHQRDRFLPLKVIKEYLLKLNDNDFDEGKSPSFDFETSGTLPLNGISKNVVDITERNLSELTPKREQTHLSAVKDKVESIEQENLSNNIGSTISTLVKSVADSNSTNNKQKISQIQESPFSRDSIITRSNDQDKKIHPIRIAHGIDSQREKLDVEDLVGATSTLTHTNKSKSKKKPLDSVLSLEKMTILTGVSGPILKELVRFSILDATGEGNSMVFDKSQIDIAEVASKLMGLGIEPRLLKTYVLFAGREVGYLEHVIQDDLRKRNPGASENTKEKAIEFIRQSAALKELMLLRAYENDTL